jgi:PhnB protein
MKEQCMKEINAYLIFDGNCGEAMQFYAKSLGAELRMMKFSEGPGQVPPEAKDRIMHARLTKGSAVLMASDDMSPTAVHKGNNFLVCINCETVQEIDSYFAALSEKGSITMPLQETFWAARFGMLTDRFGVKWMFNLEKPQT